MHMWAHVTCDCRLWKWAWSSKSSLSYILLYPSTKLNRYCFIWTSYIFKKQHVVLSIASLPPSMSASRRRARSSRSRSRRSCSSSSRSTSQSSSSWRRERARLTTPVGFLAGCSASDPILNFLIKYSNIVHTKSTWVSSNKSEALGVDELLYIECFIRSIRQEASTKKRGRREVEKGTWRIPNLGTENEGWGCVICNSNFYSHVWKEANKIGKWWDHLPLHQTGKSMKDWNFLDHLGHQHVLE